MKTKTPQLTGLDLVEATNAARARGAASAADIRTRMLAARAKCPIGDVVKSAMEAINQSADAGRTWCYVMAPRYRCAQLRDDLKVLGYTVRPAGGGSDQMSFRVEWDEMI